MEFRVKQLREDKGFSQLGLSTISGVSRQTIVEIENGTRKSVSTNTLGKLAKALECSIDDLFLG